MTKDLKYSSVGGYRIGAPSLLSEEALRRIAALADEGPRGDSAALQGRGLVARGDIPGIGSVVCKKYRRGGALGRVLSNFHLRLGSERARIEFDALNEVRALGVRVPEPVAVVSRGGVFYESWLVMREISGERSLAAIAWDDDLVPGVVDEVVRQIKILIENRVCHVDLHPGNVLLDSAGSVYLIDFDKALPWKNNLEELRDRYLNRWRRAVIKHGLREELVEQMSLGLLTNHAAYGRRS